MSTEDTKHSKGQSQRRGHHRGQQGRRRSPKNAVPDPVAGVLLVDKPTGTTSFGVIEEVRRLLGARRVGHCGTLDPMATGLLVVLIGEVTKVAQYLTDEDKAYEGQIRLGIETDTDDAEGKTLSEKDPSGVTLADAQQAAKKFLGTIMQTPPRYSAQKRQGVRAYERARAGEEFEPEARQVIVYDLALKALNDARIDFSCRVGKGTYVRSLARDLGVLLNVGAHVANLRRTHSGGFSIADAVSLPQLEAMTMEDRYAQVRSLDVAWAPRPVINLTPEDLQRVRRGQQAAIDKAAISEPPTQAATALAIHNKESVAVGKLEWDRLARSFVFSPERNLFAPSAPLENP